MRDQSTTTRPNGVDVVCLSAHKLMRAFPSERGLGHRYDTVHHGMERGDNFLEGTLDTTYISSFGKGTRTLVSNTNISMATEEGVQIALLRSDHDLEREVRVLCVCRR